MTENENEFHYPRPQRKAGNISETFSILFYYSILKLVAGRSIARNFIELNTMTENENKFHDP